MSQGAAHYLGLPFDNAVSYGLLHSLEDFSCLAVLYVRTFVAWVHILR